MEEDVKSTTNSESSSLTFSNSSPSSGGENDPILSDGSISPHKEFDIMNDGRISSDESNVSDDQNDFKSSSASSSSSSSSLPNHFRSKISSPSIKNTIKEIESKLNAINFKERLMENNKNIGDNIDQDDRTAGGGSSQNDGLDDREEIEIERPNQIESYHSLSIKKPSYKTSSVVRIETPLSSTKIDQEINEDHRPISARPKTPDLLAQNKSVPNIRLLNTNRLSTLNRSSNKVTSSNQTVSSSNSETNSIATIATTSIDPINSSLFSVSKMSKKLANHPYLCRLMAANSNNNHSDSTNCSIKSNTTADSASTLTGSKCSDSNPVMLEQSPSRVIKMNQFQANSLRTKSPILKAPLVMVKPKMFESSTPSSLTSSNNSSLLVPDIERV